MNSKLRNFFFAFSLAISSLALAKTKAFVTGVDHSGGGKAVVCRAPDESIRSVELLDIFEGEALYGLRTIALGTDYQGNVEGLRVKLRHNFKDATFMLPMDHWIDDVLRNLRLLPLGVELSPVDDAAEVALPKSCALEQLAVYKDANLLLVNQDLWNALDDVNRAALVAHEAIYKFERLGGAKNSFAARKIVAHLFSDFAFTPIMEGIPNENYQRCTAQKTQDPRTIAFDFFRYDDPAKPELTTLHFVQYKNKLVYDKFVLQSLKWPWNPRYSDMWLENPTNMEGLSGIQLRRIFEKAGSDVVKGYYFEDEEAGRFDITCWDVKSRRAN